MGQSKNSTFLVFVSTVLSLRGNHVVHQPLEDTESGSLLCWNGEAWTIDGTKIVGNDAEHVFALLLQATQHKITAVDFLSPSSEESLHGIIDVMSSIAGPYSFVFYDAKYRRILYGRDALGRRSLLTKRNIDGSVIISSVCDGSASDVWVEVDANGIYNLNLAPNFNTMENGANNYSGEHLCISESGHVLRSTGQEGLLSLPYLVQNSPTVTVTQDFD